MSKFVYTVHQPHPLYPPLLEKERGKDIEKRGLRPLLDTPSHLTSLLRREGLFNGFHPFNLPLLTEGRGSGG